MNNDLLKKFCVQTFALVAVILLVPNCSIASTTKSIDEGSFTPTFPGWVKEQPITYDKVEIKNMETNGDTFKAGDTVDVSFVLKNSNLSQSIEANYTISFVAGYEVSGLAQRKYSPANYGPINLVAGGSKYISIKYKIPKVYYTGAEQFGLNIYVDKENGQPLGMKDVKLVVTGGADAVEMIDVKIQANDKSYDLNAGPTVRSGRLSLDLAVSSYADLSKYGYTIYINKFGDPKFETVVIDKDLLSVSNTGGTISTKNISIPLPQDMASGVYVGRLEIYNDQEELVSDTLEFRYIVGGEIATIHSVTTANNYVKKGEELILYIEYTGTPIDIDGSQSSSAEGSTLYVKAYDKHEDLIGEYSSPLELNTIEKKEVKMISLLDSNKIYVETKIISKTGAVLAEKVTEMGEEIATSNENGFSDYYLLGIGIIALLALIVIIVASVIRRGNNSNMNIDNTQTSGRFNISLIVGSALILLIFALTINPAKGQTSGSIYIANIKCANPSGIYKDCGQSLGGRFSGTIDTPNTICYNGLDKCYTNNFGPYSPSVYVYTPTSVIPGESFYITGKVWDQFCLNSGHKFIISATNQTEIGKILTLNSLTSIVNEKNRTHDFSYQQGDFSIGPFIATTTPGVYSVYLQVDNDARPGGRAKIAGWVNYTISNAQNSGNGSGGGNGSSVSNVNQCGTAAGSKVSGFGGLTSSSANLCMTGSSFVSSSFGINYRSNKWFWQCSQAGAVSNCDATCSSGTYYCRSTNSCSATCSDWCENISGNQSTFTSSNGTPIPYVSIRDEDGNCTDPVASIQQFSIDPRFADKVTRQCKSYWTTLVSPSGRLACSMINASGTVPVADQNPAGLATSTGYLIPLGISALSCQTQVQDEEGNWVSVRAPVTSRVSCELPRDTIEQ